jgi:ubiquitin-protein ligase
MDELAARDLIAYRAEGSPPETYHVMFTAPGLARTVEGGLAVRNLHRCSLYLHREYPRRPPVVTWLTPVFHPNLLSPDRNGGVCIGSWSASESLADLCVRLLDLVTYRSLNAQDALDPEAGQWALRHSVERGANVEELTHLSLDPQFELLATVTSKH